jgi:hypothetical protein
MVVVDELSTDAILGLDFMEKYHCSVSIATQELLIGEDCRIPLEAGKQGREATQTGIMPVTSSVTTHIPPLSEVELDCEAPYAIAGTWVVKDMPTTTNLITA